MHKRVKKRRKYHLEIEPLGSDLFICFKIRLQQEPVFPSSVSPFQELDEGQGLVSGGEKQRPRLNKSHRCFKAPDRQLRD